MAITIRERFADNRGAGAFGTPRNPLPLPVKLDDPLGYRQTLETPLGYEAVPSTNVWAFELERPAQVRAVRRSDDPLAVHVAVALQGPARIGGSNRGLVQTEDGRGDPAHNLGTSRLSLVHTAGGVGDWHLIERGRWLLLVSLGMPIDIRVQIDVEIRPRWALGHAEVALPERGPALLVAPPELALPEP